LLKRLHDETQSALRARDRFAEHQVTAPSTRHRAGCRCP
jgi:hypothetical protein